ncbi:MAG: Fic family protein [Vitreoscilla sp.]|nr:Fic family protein [Vitreoscilla sp.]
MLRNQLGVNLVRDVQMLESQALAIAQDAALESFDATHRFTAADICQLHAFWLDGIYPWAGQYRQVNIGKGGFQFANAALIANLMRDLERDALARLTPCHGDDATVARALAEVHAELILIHPFREGNGRLARVLAVLMAMQAGLPALDFSPLLGRGKLRYISAIHAAVGRNYGPMTKVFERVIARSRRVADATAR